MAEPANSEESVKIVSLAGSLQLLKGHFNADKGNRRFLALLSPT